MKCCVLRGGWPGGVCVHRPVLRVAGDHHPQRLLPLLLLVRDKTQNYFFIGLTNKRGVKPREPLRRKNNFSSSRFTDVFSIVLQCL